MHYLTACLIFKDSAPYLDEWVRFHLLVGFDHLYLYDNDSSDDPAAILQPSVDSGCVTLHTWPGKGQQSAVFQHCLDTYRNDARWLAYIDDDEFLFPAVATSLKDVMPAYEQHAGVAACWLLFGSSGHRQRPSGLVTMSYTRRSDWVDKHVKCIVDPARVTGPSIGGHAFHCTRDEIVDEHHQPIDGPFSTTPSADVLCLNHYVTKSEEEMVARRSRTAVDGNAPPHSIDTWRLWEPYYNGVEDLRIRRFADRLEQTKPSRFARLRQRLALITNR